jgi:hypothetical protein
MIDDAIGREHLEREPDSVMNKRRSARVRLERVADHRGDLGHPTTLVRARGRLSTSRLLAGRCMVAVGVFRSG